MIRTTSFSVLTRITALIFIVGVFAVTIVSMQDTSASAISGITRGNGGQGIANTTIGAGSNITRAMLIKNAILDLS